MTPRITKKLLVLANSTKSRGRCVAGIEILSETPEGIEYGEFIENHQLDHLIDDNGKEVEISEGSYIVLSLTPPFEPCCYIGNRADYELIAQSDLFKNGLERIRQGLESMRVSLMCAEKDPLDCHRTLLVARHAQKFTEVDHIHIDGSIETHAELEARMLSKIGMGDEDLFLSHEDQLAIAYKRRGEEIAYKRDEPERLDYEH